MGKIVPKKHKLVSILFFFTLLLFTIYTYTQVDLNLTLWNNSNYQRIQQILLWIGYFNRPLSSLIYVALLISLFFCYISLLVMNTFSHLSLSRLKLFLVGSSLLLFFSYPAFSHDIFNYMFDARIVTKYFSNPYVHTALQFPDDLWVRFMHWTHRVYPYGPVWLIVTISFSFIGFGKFVATLALFKLLFILTYFGNCFFIYRILNRVDPSYAVRGVMLFALNPLILIETIISPHNEALMLFFLLFALYLIFIHNKKVSGIVMFILSAGVKFITALAIIPTVYFFLSRRKMTYHRYVVLISLSIAIGIGYEVFIREAYPWYFVMLVGSLSLIPTNAVSIGVTVVSAAALMRYLPYLYTGEYSVTTAAVGNVFFFVPLFLLGIYYLRLYFLRMR